MTTTTRRHPSLYGAFTAILAALVVAAIVYPTVRLLLRAFIADGKLSGSAFSHIASQPWFGGMLRNTFLAVGTSVICAVCIASVFAWLNERTDAKLPLVGQLIPLLPLLMPPTALTVGWVFLAFPKVGVLNVAIDRIAPWTAGGILNIHSFPGLIFVYTLFFVPLAYLVIAAALQNLDPSMEEASMMSGAGLWRTVIRVSIPSIAPALAGAALLAGMTGLAIYSIPVIIGTRPGIDVLSVRVVRSITYTYPPRVDEAIALAVVMLFAIGALWIVHRLVSRWGHFAIIGGRSVKGNPPFRLGPWRWVARTGMILFLVVTSVLPFVGLIVVAIIPYWGAPSFLADLSLNNYRGVLFERPITIGALRNSLYLGAVGATIALGIAAVLARYIHRPGPAPFRGIVDGVSKLPAVLSNLVLGMAFLFAFGGPPFNLAGTLLFLLFAYVVVHMPQASITTGASAAQVGGAMSEASYMCGAGEGRTVRKIVFPLMLPGAIRGWALLFIIMAGDVSVSILITSARTPVIGVTLLDIWESGSFGLLAALASTYALLTASVVSLALALAHRMRWE